MAGRNAVLCIAAIVVMKTGVKIGDVMGLLVLAAAIAVEN
jgi:hypothetical protein